MLAAHPVLARVLWIGGPPDSGKTAVTKVLAPRYGTLWYEYDRSDRRHHKRLAQTINEHRAFLDASFDERWLAPTPRELAERAVRSFADRLPLVLEDLDVVEQLHFSPIVAEGFGFTPELVAPLVAWPQQAVWLVPTRRFRSESWERRNKPAFAAQTSDPEKAAANLFARDELLTELIRSQARERGFTLLEVDGSQSAAELADRLERHFAAYVAG